MKWIDEHAEEIPDIEIQARTDLECAKREREEATQQRIDVNATAGVEAKQNKARMALLRRSILDDNVDSATRQNLSLHQLQVLAEINKGKQNEIDTAKSRYKEAEARYKQAKSDVERLRKERGRPAESIQVEIDCFIAMRYNIKRAAYHGGDFNGVCCHLLVANAREIMNDIQRIVLEKMIVSCQPANVCKKMDQVMRLLGLIDATISGMKTIAPTDDERNKLDKSISHLMRCWRDCGLSVTYKAHVTEHHVRDKNDEFGIAEKDESFIEKAHQKGARIDQRLACITSFTKKYTSAFRQEQISTHPDVMNKQEEVRRRSKRNFGNLTNTGLRASEADKIRREKEVKEGKRQRFVNNDNKE
jgi:hypothetical protein